MEPWLPVKLYGDPLAGWLWLFVRRESGLGHTAPLTRYGLGRLGRLGRVGRLGRLGPSLLIVSISRAHRGAVNGSTSA